MDSTKELKFLLSKGNPLRLKRMNMKKKRTSNGHAISFDLRIKLGPILSSYFLFFTLNYTA